MTKKPDMLLIFKIEQNEYWDGINPFSEVECTLTIQTSKKIMMSKFVEMRSSFRVGLELYSILIDRFRELSLPINHDFLSELALDASSDIQLNEVLSFAMDFENIPMKGQYYE